MTRVRAVVLSTFLVLAAVGGTVAFAGTAAAVSNAGVALNDSTAGVVTNHAVTATVDSDEDGSSLGSVYVDYSSGTSATDVSNVDQSDVTEAYIVRDDDDTRENVMDDLTGVKKSNNGHTLKVTFGGSYSLDKNDVVHVTYDDVQNPKSAGNYQTDVTLNQDSSTAKETVKFDVTERDLKLNVTASPPDDDRSATHRVAATPGSPVSGEVLDSFTLDYGSEYSGDLSAVDAAAVNAAFVDADGDYEKDDGETSLSVSKVTNENGALTFTFDGSHELSQDTPVVLAYDAENPASAGSVAVTGYFNGETTTTASDTLHIEDLPLAHVHPYAHYSGANTTHDVHVHDLGANNVGDSLNGIKINYGAGAHPADVAGVDQSDIQYVEIYRSGEIVNATGDLSSADASDDGKTLTLGFTGNYNLKEGDEIHVSFDDVKNPTVSGTTASEVGVTVNPQSSGKTAYDTVNYREAQLRATVHSASGDAARNATHTTEFSPGQTQGGDDLSSVTVSYDELDAEWYTSPTFDGNLSQVDAEDVEAVTENGQELSVTSVTHPSETKVTFEFDGSYALETNTEVTLQYHDVQSPTTAGAYDANVNVNSESAAETSTWIRVYANTSTANASLSTADDTPGSTTTHTVTATAAPGDDSDRLDGIEIQYEGDVTLDSLTVESVGIDTNGDGTAETSVAASDYSVSTSDGGIDIAVSGHTVDADDRVVVEYSGVTNPSSESETTVQVGINNAIDAGYASAVLDVNAEDTSGGNSGSSDDGDDDSSSNDGNSNPNNSGSSGSDDGSNSGSGSDSSSNNTTTATTTSTVTTTASSDDGSNADSTTTTMTTSSETTTSTQSPGFGVAVALVALLGAALVALRRRD